MALKKIVYLDEGQPMREVAYTDMVSGELLATIRKLLDVGFSSVVLTVEGKGTLVETDKAEKFLLDKLATTVVEETTIVVPPRKKNQGFTEFEGLPQMTQ